MGLVAAAAAVAEVVVPGTVAVADTHTHTRLTALFQDYPGEPVPDR